MPLLDGLRAEHDLIERVSERLLSYAGGTAGPSSTDDGAAFMRFLRVYADRFHHAREEDVPVAAMKERASP